MCKQVLRACNALLIIATVTFAAPLNSILAASESSSLVSPWLNSTLPVLQKLETAPVGQGLPYAINNNRDCEQRKLITQPARNFIAGPNYQSEISTTGCVVRTDFGVVDVNGLTQLDDTKIAGQAVPYAGFTSVIPIPNSTTVLHYSSIPTNGLRVHFTKDILTSIKSEIASDGKITYRFAQQPDVTLQDKSGSIMPGYNDSLSFSNNGKWMVIDSPSRAMLRVNLSTFEVLPFAPTFNYDIGLSPQANTAISNDGRYAAVASKDFGVFKNL